MGDTVQLLQGDAVGKDKLSQGFAVQAAAKKGSGKSRRQLLQKSGVCL